MHENWALFIILEIVASILWELGFIYLENAQCVLLVVLVNLFNPFVIQTRQVLDLYADRADVCHSSGIVSHSNSFHASPNVYYSRISFYVTLARRNLIHCASCLSFEF